jgi:nucleotide-binding universal stress UspA family protein
VNKSESQSNVSSRPSPEFDAIAVALDFSPSSLGALEAAKRLAKPGARLKLIHVVDSALYFRGPTYGDPVVADRLFQDLLRGGLAQLETLAEELRVARFRVDCVARVGRPADQILEASEGTDLLAVGSQGRGALGRILLGSVAEEVARRSAIPVLVVREGTAGGLRSIERVVVAVDPTGPSRDAIRVAASVANRTGARLEAIHSASLPTVLPYADAGALLKLNSALTAHLAEAPALVQNLIAKTIGAKDVKVRVLAGPPADEIVRFTTPNDLLVCGTHARSALGRFVFGSVAVKLVRHAPCPVLVVRPHEDEEPREELAHATAGARRDAAAST